MSTAAVSGAPPTGVKLDGTLGGPAAVIPGPTYNIAQSLGKLAGGNLYFSFDYFNIATAETALFTTTSAGIHNVISRVTGGYASTIDGTIALQAASGTPNFFLINPSGVTFSANARINVPAAFAVTTADYLRFPDGVFYVNPLTQSTLSAAAPQSFGFLGATRAAVNLYGATLSGGVAGSGAVTIAAGDVTVDGLGGPTGIINAGGAITVTAVGGTAVEIPLIGAGPSTDGTVTIRNGGALFTYGGGPTVGGAIEVNTGSLLIDGVGDPNPMGILSYAVQHDSGAINVAVAKDATIVNGGEISTIAFGAGNGGAINLQAGSLSIVGDATTGFTGVSAQTNQGSLGSAGNITVGVAGAASLTDGGRISSDSFGLGNAGTISVNAQSVVIDGGASTFITGISSDTFGAGNAGVVTLAAQSLSITGQPTNLQTGVSTNSYGAGSTGQLDVQLDTLDIYGGNSPGFVGIFSQSNNGAPSPTGEVKVAVSGSASISDGGQVSTTTFGSENAGALSFSAQSLAINGANSPYGTGLFAETFGTGNAGHIQFQLGSLSVDGGTGTADTGIFSAAKQSTGAAGDITGVVTGNATLANGGFISSSTSASGNAGQVTLQTGTLSIDGGSAAMMTGVISLANSGASGSAGQVNITVAGAVSIKDSGLISSTTQGPGNGGEVSLQAAQLTIDGGTSTTFTGISSDADQGSGSAGGVGVKVTGAASILNGGAVSSSSFSAGNAGVVNFQSGSLVIDGGTSNILTGILSQANLGSTGTAGSVSVTVPGTVSITDAGTISSATFGPGHAGDIQVTLGSLTMNGLGTAIGSVAELGSSGAAGAVSVTVANGATLTNGAEIDSSTHSTGNAGEVTLQLGSLTINGDGAPNATGIASQSNPGATGSAGDVTVAVAGAALLGNGGVVSTSTFGAGNAGRVTFETDTLILNGAGTSNVTGIASLTEAGSSGNAGTVSVTATGGAILENGGLVSTRTAGSGAAGDVDFTAGTLMIGNGGATSKISSGATAGSSGQTGRVTLNVDSLQIGPAGSISISNAATLPEPQSVRPTDIAISAQSINMTGGNITAASTGNVAASAINIDFNSVMRLDLGSITTSSNDGNGGPIIVQGLGPLFINHSNITTSVLGSRNGNGGNIDIDVTDIVFDTGAIQANTLAPLASGGTVALQAQTLVPSYESFVVGGRVVTFAAASEGLNVVQAAAPDGVSGTLDITAPIQYLGTSLLGLTGRPYVAPALGRSPCGFTQGSSLAVSGRGGLPPSGYDPLGVSAATLAESDSASLGSQQPAIALGAANPSRLTDFACR